MYDAIVVGARCAGAATALLLARKGHRVLLVDRAQFPSDMRLSTHLVWQPGVARLEEWGLHGELAASGCPPGSPAARSTSALHPHRLHPTGRRRPRRRTPRAGSSSTRSWSRPRSAPGWSSWRAARSTS